MIKGYIEHVAIKVTDLEWFLDFFTTVLGFEERKREEKEGQISQTWLSSNIAVLQAIRLQDSSIDSVVADFFDCGYQSTKYLVKKGCKKIGFINGSLEVMPYRDRYKGYRKAIKKYGLEEFVHEATLPTTKYYADGFMGTKELLEKHPDLDSIMVAVDMQAMGAIRAIKKSGRKIPNDIRLISLTGHSIDSILETALTSMEIPAIEMGHYATEVIINLIESSEETKRRRQHIVFESTLRERETT